MKQGREYPVSLIWAGRVAPVLFILDEFKNYILRSIKQETKHLQHKVRVITMQKLKKNDCLAFLIRAERENRLRFLNGTIEYKLKGNRLVCRCGNLFMHERRLNRHKFTGFFKPHLSEILEKYRKKLKLTQCKMAEKMAISTRYYHDLKHAISMLSLIEFIFVLRLLSDEEKLNLIHDVENLIESEEFKDYLDKIDFM